MHFRHVGGLVLVLFTVSRVHLAVAQPLVVSMTRESIDAAIRHVSDEKSSVKFLDAYVLQNRAGWGNGPRIGIVSTPFSRVVQIAVTERKQGKVLTAADVPPDLIDPELHVIATSEKGASDDNVVNVFSVVLAPRGSRNGAEALQPIRKVDLSSEYQSRYGTTFTGLGVVAVFPLSTIPQDSEVRVIFEQAVRGSSGIARCQECIVPLNLERVR